MPKVIIGITAFGQTEALDEALSAGFCVALLSRKGYGATLEAAGHRAWCAALQYSLAA